MAVSLTNFEIDSQSPLPLHRQIERWLREQIETGALSPGDMLPARKEFSEMLGGINHLTIRQAVSALAREGLIQSTPGRGTFVTKPKAKQLSIGVVLPSIDDELTQSIVDGIQQYFENSPDSQGAAIRTVLFDSRRSPQKELDNIAHLQDLPLDGAIILPVRYGDLVEKLVQLKVDRFPLALIGWVPGIKFNSVSADDYAGTYAATRHVVETGRKRIAWIRSRDGVFSAEARVAGFRDALNDGGLLYDRNLNGEFTLSTPKGSLEQAIKETLDRVLALPQPPDALVCANDFSALLCLKELKRRSIRVPEDISVVGFDNIRTAAESDPPLTTISYSMVELGREAARLVLDAVRDPSTPPRAITLPVELIKRRST